MQFGVVPRERFGFSVCSAVKAGRWVFLSGLFGGDLENGLAPEVLGRPGLPLAGLPRHRREGDAVLRRMVALLDESGAPLSNAVRLDQFYPTAAAVDPYHHARKACFGSLIPPSTSVLAEELLVDGAALDVSLIAVLPGHDMEPRRAIPPDVPVPEHSGFATSVAAGDYVFVAGQMANNEAMSELAGPAYRPAKAIWNGTDVRLQTEFLITSRLKPSLAAAGSSLANAVKAQVYLTDPADLPNFMDVWNRHFGDNPCALTVVTTSGLGFSDAVIEINLIALRDDGATQKQVIDDEASRPMRLGPAAVRAGDLVFLSGLYAADEDGLIPSARRAGHLKPFGGSAREQMRAILAASGRILEASGSALPNVVRAQHFYEDFGGFLASQQVWQEVLPDHPVPLQAVRLPPGPVPGCELVVDLWGYAPMDGA
uniref:RidA family protein n=1 Tax=Ancylobacter mangrovi TaxID=2972472 RepID=UPI00216292D4|nr:RidA family protein [Ancylobacter mangrovi]